MKLKKVFAGVASAAMLATTLASVSASADWTPTEGQYNATLCIANGDWSVSSMAPQGYRGTVTDGRAEGGYIQDAIVTGDGTYTVKLEFPPDGDMAGGDQYITGKITDGVVENANCNTWNTEGGYGEFYAVTVFCIDIYGLCDGTEKLDTDMKTYVEMDPASYKSDIGITAGPYKASKITATVDSIKQDGEAVSFNADKVITGNIEGNFNYRLEIFNAYGDTKDGRVLADDSIDFMNSLEVQFTISGIDAQKSGSSTTGTTASTSSSSASGSVQQTTQAADTNSTGSSTTTSSSTGADTGATAGLALGGIALAGVAVVLAKKRK